MNKTFPYTFKCKFTFIFAFAFTFTLIPVAGVSSGKGAEDFCRGTRKVSVCRSHRSYQPFLADDRCREFGKRLTGMVSKVLSDHCKTAENTVPKFTKIVLCRELAQARQAYQAVISAPPCGSGDVSCLAQAADKVKKELPAMQHHWSDLYRLQALYKKNLVLFQIAAEQYRQVGRVIINGTTYRECNKDEKSRFRQTANQLSQESQKVVESTQKLIKKLKPRLKEMEEQKAAFNTYAKRTMEATCREDSMGEGSITGATQALCTYLAETQEKVNREPDTVMETVWGSIRDRLDGTGFGDFTGLGKEALPAADQIRADPNLCLRFASHCKAGMIKAIEGNENLKPEAKKLLQNYFENLESGHLFMLTDKRTADFLDQLDAAGDDSVKQFDAIAGWTRNNAAFDALLTDKWGENKELVNGLLDTLPQSTFEHRIKLAKGLLNHELLDQDPSLVVSFKNAAFNIATTGMNGADPADPAGPANALRAYQNFLNTGDPNVTEAGYAILEDNEELIRNAVLEDLRSGDEKSFFSFGLGLENQNYRNLAYAYAQSSFDLKTLGKSLDAAVPLLDKNTDVATLSAAFQEMVTSDGFWEKTEKFLAGKSIGMDGREVTNASLVGAAAQDLNRTLQAEIRAHPDKYAKDLGIFMPTNAEFKLIDKVFEKPTPESLVSGVRYVRNLATAESAVDRIGIAKELYDSSFVKENIALVDEVLEENFQRIRKVQERFAIEMDSSHPLNKFEKELSIFLAERGITGSHVDLAWELNRGLDHEQKAKSLDYAFRLLGGTKDGSPPVDGQLIEVLAEISKDKDYAVTEAIGTSEKVFPALKQAMRDSYSFYTQAPPDGGQTRLAKLGLGEKQVELIGALIDEATPSGIRVGLDAFNSATHHQDDPIAMLKWAAAVNDSKVIQKHEGLVRDAIDESLVNLTRAFNKDGKEGEGVPSYYTVAKDYLIKNGFTREDVKLARQVNQFFTGAEKTQGARFVAQIMSSDIDSAFGAMEEMAAFEGRKQFRGGADLSNLSNRSSLSENVRLLDRTITFVNQDRATSEAFRSFTLRRFAHFESGLKKAGFTDAQIRFGKLGLEEWDLNQVRSGLAYMDLVISPDRTFPQESIGIIRDTLDTPFMKDHSALATQAIRDSVVRMKEAFMIPSSERTAYQQKIFEELIAAKTTVHHLELAEAVISSTSGEGKVLAADIAYRLAGGDSYAGGKYLPNVNTPGFDTGKEWEALSILPEHATVVKAILNENTLPGDMALELASDIVDAAGRAQGDQIRIQMMQALQNFAVKHPEKAQAVGQILVHEHFEATRKVIAFELAERGRIQDPGIFATLDAATKEGAYEVVTSQEVAFHILGSKDPEEGYQRFKAAALAEPDVLRRLAVANKGSVQVYASQMLKDLKANPPKDMDWQQYQITVAGLEGITTPVDQIPSRREPASVRKAPTGLFSGLSFLFGGIGFAQHEKRHYIDYADYLLRKEGADDDTIRKFGLSLYEARRDDFEDSSITVNGKNFSVKAHLRHARSMETLGITASHIPQYARELGYQYAASDYHNPKAGISPKAIEHNLEQVQRLKGYIGLLPDDQQAAAQSKLNGMIQLLEACQAKCNFTTVGTVAGSRAVVPPTRPLLRPQRRPSSP